MQFPIINHKFIYSTLITIILSVNILANDKPLELVYFQDYAPFSWKEDGKMKGILIDIFDTVLKDKMKISINHTGYPWKRAQMLVKYHKADAFCTVPTTARKEYTVISKEAVIFADYTMFTTKDNKIINKLKTIKQISQLKDFKMGHILGGGWAKRNLKDMNIIWVPNSKQVFKMMNGHRFDLFLNNRYVTLYTLKQLGLDDNIVEIPNVLATNPFKLCIDKQSPYTKIIPQFDKIIKQMKSDGSLERIYKKYL